MFVTQHCSRNLLFFISTRKKQRKLQYGINSSGFCRLSLVPNCEILYLQIFQVLKSEAVQYKAQIDLFVGLGKVIIDITAQQPSDSAQTPLEEDLLLVRTRYNDVWKGLETRNVLLETTVAQMEKYRRLVRSTAIFLDQTEKRLGNLEAVAGETDVIRRQISEHKAGRMFFQPKL